MNIAKQIAEELKIKVWQVEAVMELIDEGCTIPFIARYRKEKHGSLNDEQLRNLDERLTYLRNLEERKETVPAYFRYRHSVLADDMALGSQELFLPYRRDRAALYHCCRSNGYCL